MVSTESIQLPAHWDNENNDLMSTMAHGLCMKSLPQSSPKQLDCPYLLLCMDKSRNLGFEASPSLADCVDDIFTQDVKDRFLERVSAVGQDKYLSIADPVQSTWDDGVSNQDPYSRYQSASLGPLPKYPTHESLSHSHPGPTRPTPLIPCLWQPQPKKRRRRHNTKNARSDFADSSGGPGSSKLSPIRLTTLEVSNGPILRRYYEKAFDAFQQVNCKVIAKAFVKVVEPRKQVSHPYNGRIGPFQHVNPELSKPDWWPTGVTHREPDHLLKPGKYGTESSLTSGSHGFDASIQYFCWICLPNDTRQKGSASWYTFSLAWEIVTTSRLTNSEKQAKV